MSRSDVESFCRASSQLQSLKTAHAQSQKKLLLRRKELRQSLLEALPAAATINAGPGVAYTLKKRSSYKSLTEGRIREAFGRVFRQQHEGVENVITAMHAVLQEIRKNPETVHLIRKKGGGTETVAGSEEARALAKELAEVEDRISELNAAHNLTTLELTTIVRETKPRVLQFLRRGRELPVTKNVSLSGGGGFSTKLKLKTFYQSKPINNKRLNSAIRACFRSFGNKEAFVDTVCDHLAREGATLQVKISNRRIVHCPY